MIAGLTFLALLFCVLHWPGGHGLRCKVIPALVAVLLVLIGIYVFRFGALKALAEKGVYGASYLQKTEGTAFIVIAVLIIGLLLRSMHIPGGSMLFMLSCYTLTILSGLAGFWAFTIFRK